MQGDQGGPLVFKNSDGDFELVGLVSVNFSCGEGRPGLYTEVAYYIDWINDNMP